MALVIYCSISSLILLGHNAKQQRQSHEQGLRALPFLFPSLLCFSYSPEVPMSSVPQMQQALWRSCYSCCLRCQHPRWELVHSLDSLVWIQLWADGLGKAALGTEHTLRPTLVGYPSRLLPTSLCKEELFFCRIPHSRMDVYLFLHC